MSEWIDVNKKLPPDYHEVLYFAKNDIGGTQIMTGHREHGNWTHCCCFYSTRILNDNVKVSHWAELLEPTENKE